MKKVGDRRDFLLTAAAAPLSLISCTAKNRIAGRVNVICHGMMVLQQCSAEAKKQELKIYLPNPLGGGDRTPLFSEICGGKMDLLQSKGGGDCFALLLTQEKKKAQELRMQQEGAEGKEAAKQVVRWKGDLSAAQSQLAVPPFDETLFLNTLVAGEEKASRLTIADNLCTRLTLPMPSSVHRYRPVVFEGPVYDQSTGNAAGFGLTAKMLWRVHVLRYEAVLSPPILRGKDPATDRVLGPEGEPKSLNLYLYARNNRLEELSNLASVSTNGIPTPLHLRFGEKERFRQRLFLDESGLTKDDLKTFEEWDAGLSPEVESNHHLPTTTHPAESPQIWAV